MNAKQFFCELFAVAPISRGWRWVNRIWCVAAVTVLIWGYAAERALGALALVPFALIFLAATEIMAWSFARKVTRLINTGIPLIAIVTGKGITWRGQLAWMCAVYSIGRQQTGSRAYVSRKTYYSCRVGDQITIRILPDSPRFWVAESDVGVEPGNLGR